MNKDDVKAILTKDKDKTLSHACKDLVGKEYFWVSRKNSPVACPRCKARLDVKRVSF